MARQTRLAYSLIVILALTAVGAALLLAPAAVAGAPGSLRFIEAYAGVEGVAGASGVAVSPDSRHVYVTGAEDDGIAVFEVDPGAGPVAFVESDREGEVEGGVTIDGLEGAADVAVSADGRNVYVAAGGDDAIATFARDAGSGSVRLIDVDRDAVGGVDGIAGANGVAVAPDGRSVYVAGFADDAVAAFTRDPETGELGFLEVYRAPFPDPDLDGAFAVSVTPDGDAVYVASFTGYAIVAFRRDATAGALELAGLSTAGKVFGLEGPVAVAPSPYGRDVYSVALRSSALHRFRRSVPEQSLAFQGYVKDGLAGVDGIAAASGLALAPDGTGAYATGALDDAIAFFEVRDATGELFFREDIRQGDDGIDGLDGAAGLAIAPDGRRVYAIASEGAGDTLAVFARRRVPLLGPVRARDRRRLRRLSFVVRCSRSCTLRAKARGRAAGLTFASGHFRGNLPDDVRHRIRLRFHPAVLRAVRGESADVVIRIKARDRLGNTVRRTLRVEIGP